MPELDGNSSGSEGEGAVDKKSGWTPRLWVLLVVCALLLCLLLAAIGLIIKLKKSESPPSVAPGVKSAKTIIRPVPQLDYREMLDFLIVFKVQDQDMIAALRMEAGFDSMLRYANFKKKTVVFRDTVYNFLLRQNGADNSAKSWQSLLGKNLLDYRKVNLPDSCPDRISLTQVENQ